MREIRFREHDQLYIVRKANGEFDTDLVFASEDDAEKAVAGIGEVVTIVPNDWDGVQPELVYKGTGYITMQTDGRLFGQLVKKTGLSNSWINKHFGGGGFTRMMLFYYRSGKSRVPYAYKELMRGLADAIDATYESWKERHGKKT